MIIYIFNILNNIFNLIKNFILFRLFMNLLKNKFFFSILNFSINSGKEIENFIKNLKESNLSNDWINYIIKSKRYHKWHLVSPSPWPFFSSLSAFILVIGFILWMNKISSSEFFPSIFFTGFLLLLSIMFVWFRDIIREGFLGYHTTSVLRNLRMGFILFIVSEVMFFASFFWAYFHFSIDPSIWSGDIWPPEGIVYFWLCENVSYSNVNSGILSEWFYKCSYLFKIHPTDYFYNVFSDNERLVKSDNIFTKAKTFNTYFHFCNIFDNDNNRNYAVYSKKFLTSNIDDSSFHIIPQELNNDSTIKTTVLYEFKRQLELYFDYFHYACNNFILMPIPDDKEEDVLPIPLSKKKLFDVGIPFTNIHFNLYDKGLLINPFKIPLLNTCILLTSGAWLTISHIKLKKGEIFESLIFLIITLIFAIFFVLLQFGEYVKSGFGINDTIYGGIFYMLTGFHGFHVIIGTIFLAICLIRMHYMHFSPSNHFGFEAAIWYRHFVDVVWVFLYIFVYLWPGFYFYTNHFNSESSLIYQLDLPDSSIGVSVDYLLSEYPNSVFNYHKSWNSYVKNKIIWQIANCSFAKDKMEILDYGNYITRINKCKLLISSLPYDLVIFIQYLFEENFKEFELLNYKKKSYKNMEYWYKIFNIKDEDEVGEIPYGF